MPSSSALITGSGFHTVSRILIASCPEVSFFSKPWTFNNPSLSARIRIHYTFRLAFNLQQVRLSIILIDLCNPTCGSAPIPWLCDSGLFHFLRHFWPGLCWEHQFQWPRQTYPEGLIRTLEKFFFVYRFLFGVVRRQAKPLGAWGLQNGKHLRRVFSILVVM